jgi:hypothetical protein
MAYIPHELYLQVLKFLSRIEIENIRLISKYHKAVVQYYSTDWPDYVLDTIIAEVYNGEQFLRVLHQGYEDILIERTPIQQGWKFSSEDLWGILARCWFRRMHCLPRSNSLLGIYQVFFFINLKKQKYICRIEKN